MSPEIITYQAIPHPLPARAAIKLMQLGNLCRATAHELDQLPAASKSEAASLRRNYEALQTELANFENDLRRVHGVSVTRPMYVSKQKPIKEQHHAGQ